MTPKGLYCPIADVYIDPWRSVGKALITHAHSDHARPGHGEYVCTPLTLPVLRHRLGAGIRVRSLRYGEILRVNGVGFSFHPAGHIPGSAQVRIEHKGEVWVVTGDYKLQRDGISEPFEPVRCHTLITESTFGLPVYQWPDPEEVHTGILDWWRTCREQGTVAVLTAYSLGKAQRLLSRLDPSIGPIYVHGAIEPVNAIFRTLGIGLPETRVLVPDMDASELDGAMVLAPPSVLGSGSVKRLGPVSEAMASGWMALRGIRRRRASGRGFVLSDHADWPGLLEAVRGSGAERVWVTHGYTEAFARHLRETGLDARPLVTHFQGEAPDGRDDSEGSENDRS